MTIKVVIPGNYIQSGPPSDVDRHTAVELGMRAVHCVNEERYGVMPCIERRTGSDEIYTSLVQLTDVVGKDKVCMLHDGYYDPRMFKMTGAFLDYMKPILGEYKRAGLHDYYYFLESLRKEE